MLATSPVRPLPIALAAILVLAARLALPAPVHAQPTGYTGGLVLRDALDGVAGGVVDLDQKVVRLALAVDNEVVIVEWDALDGFFDSTRPDAGGWDAVFFAQPDCQGDAILHSQGLALATGGLHAALAGTSATHPTAPELLLTAPASAPFNPCFAAGSMRLPDGTCAPAPDICIPGYAATATHDLSALFPAPRRLARARAIFCDGLECGTTLPWSATRP